MHVLCYNASAPGGSSDILPNFEQISNVINIVIAPIQLILTMIGVAIAYVQLRKQPAPTSATKQVVEKNVGPEEACDAPYCQSKIEISSFSAVNRACSMRVRQSNGNRDVVAHGKLGSDDELVTNEEIGETTE